MVGNVLRQEQEASDHIVLTGTNTWGKLTFFIHFSTPAMEWYCLAISFMWNILSLKDML